MFSRNYRRTNRRSVMSPFIPSGESTGCRPAAGTCVVGATVREAEVLEVSGASGDARRTPLLRRSMDHARMIDARAAALRSRVEELAKASFHKDDSLASKTRSHLSVPAQTKVRGLEHGTIVARACTRRAPGVLLTNSAARE